MSGKLTHIIHRQTYNGHQSKVMYNSYWTNRPKVLKILKCFITLKEMEDASISPPCIGQVFFAGQRKNVAGRTYPVVNFPVYLEARWCIFHIVRGLNL